MKTSIALMLLFTAFALIGATCSSSKGGPKEDIVILCDHAVIRSVEGAQYDRARLITVLRKEKAAGTCVVIRSAPGVMRSSDRNQVVCRDSGTCGLYIQSDIYGEVR